MIASLRGRCAFGNGLVIDLHGMCEDLKRTNSNVNVVIKHMKITNRSNEVSPDLFPVERRQREDDTRNRDSDRVV